MKLKLDFEPTKMYGLDYRQSYLFAGSCFSTNIGEIFKDHQMETLINPFGVVYNPVSIARSFEQISQTELYGQGDLVEHNGLFHSMDHHGSFSAANPAHVTQLINEELAKAKAFLNTVEVIVLTLGTAWVYRYKPTGRE